MTKTLSTPQVSALLSISMPTLARYAKIYKRHFTATAAQNKRGRRWTPEDVEKVILISRLGITRMGVDRIDKILDDPEADDNKLPDVMRANQVLEIAANVLSEVEEHRRAITKMIKLAEWQRIDYLTLKRRYDRDIKAIYKKLDDQIYFIQKVMVMLDVRQDALKKRGKQRGLINKLPDAFERWAKETLPEDYKNATDPASWLDSIPKYKPPDDENEE
jgi:DNA-binding transcriptional MerR regulator